MALSDEEYKELYDLIDFSKLKRDYRSDPVPVGRRLKNTEYPEKEDLFYLFIELNLPYDFLDRFFQRNTFDWMQFYKIKKDPRKVIENSQKTNLKKFGVKNPFSNKEIQEKAKQKCVEKFGVENIFQKSDYIKQKTAEKYGVERYSQLPIWKEKCKKTNQRRRGFDWNTQDPKNKEKQKETSLKNWGKESPNQSSVVKERQRKSMLERHGVEYAAQNKEILEKQKETYKKHRVENPEFLNHILEKAKQTCLEHFGVEYSTQSEEVKEKAKQTCLEKYNCEYASQSPEIKEKAKQTMIEKYGVENAFQSPEIKEKAKQTNLEKYGVPYSCQNPWVQQKIYDRKKQNNSFNKSRSEEEIYEILLKKYPDTVRQYKCERYPFACDFYIKSLDLFIEYQGTWMHGFHPFDENNPKDVEEKNKWLKKAEEINFKGEKKKSYEEALRTWTVSDVKKRTVAKENNLNWLEFFDLKQFKNWIDKGE